MVIVTTVALLFDPTRSAETLHGELSAAVEIGRDLWLAADEGASVERLSPLAEGYGAHASFRLADYLNLSKAADEEIDIEGLDYDDGYLWLVGSHGIQRKAIDGPHAGDSGKKRLRRLAQTSRTGNRSVLARIPLVASSSDASLQPARKADQPRHGGDRRAGLLRRSKRGNALIDTLGDDPHLAPALEVPEKENGFDIEGIAVRGGRVYLGLRGPVLQGWAVVLVVEPEQQGNELRLTPVGPKRRLYEKHFLDLRGLGVRELCVDGDHLLVLAGPTMQLDGDAAIFRWRDALASRGDTIVERDRLEKIMDLPYGRGEEESVDHPEGMALLHGSGDSQTLLVLYDSPSAERRVGDTGVKADLFDLPR